MEGSPREGHCDAGRARVRRPGGVSSETLLPPERGVRALYVKGCQRSGHLCTRPGEGRPKGSRRTLEGEGEKRGVRLGVGGRKGGAHLLFPCEGQSGCLPHMGEGCEEGTRKVGFSVIPQVKGQEPGVTPGCGLH